MAGKEQSFRDRIFSIHHHSDREDNVPDYVILRLWDGADLDEDLVREE